MWMGGDRMGSARLDKAVIREFEKSRLNRLGVGKK